MAKVIQVIETEITRGKGIEGDPIRGVTQYWSLDGDLLAEHDPVEADRPSPTIMRGEQLLRDLYGKQNSSPVTTFTNDLPVPQ